MVGADGNFDVDSAVSGSNGRYTATLAPAWEIWGPQGGYVAAIALRAAGLASPFPYPVSFACHFLRTPSFAPVDIRVDQLRQARRAASLRVTVTQDDAAMLDAFVWTVAELSGLPHQGATMPDVPRPTDVEPWDAHLPGGEPPFAFWRNFDVRPVVPRASEWRAGAHEPRWLVWIRLRTRPRLDDPYVDAGRVLMAADSTMFPAATFAHEQPFPYIAPSLDLTMSFHATASDSEWLLVDAHSPLASRGIVAGNASVWTADGQLLGSALQQMLQRVDTPAP